MPNLIVLLPGLTGSVLRQGGRDLWTPPSVVRALISLGNNLEALRLEEDPPDIDDLSDGVTADRVWPDVHLIPGLWRIDGYSGLSHEIQRIFAVEPGRNFFEFAYDWRRDIRVAARRLARQSHAWLKAWRETSGNRDARLILVAHSMGGLVSRYFLECMEGWRHTTTLITFGTPYWGSPNALDSISNGYRRSLGPVQVADLTDLIRSFTSVYQLLPVYPCYDPGDGRLVLVGETTGIPHVDPTRARQALAFYREMDECAKTNASNEDYRRNGYKLYPIAGIGQPTLQAAKLISGRLVFSNEFPGRDFDGDGTVPKPSAKPRNFDRDSFFVVERHSSLQNSKPALGQLRGLLTGDDFDRTWGPGALSLRLVVEDSYVVGKPIVIRAEHEPRDLRITLEAIVQDTATGTIVHRRPVRALTRGAHETMIRGLAVGTYRITIRTGSDSVTDVFIVV